MIKVTYYLDMISSWCYYFEEAWDQLKEEFEPQVHFDWRIAMIPPEGLPETREEEEWYYRRSGMVTRWPVMLNSGWVEPGRREYLAPNAVAEACRDFGVVGDEARRALTCAVVEDGCAIADWEVCADVVAPLLPDISKTQLLERARSEEISRRLEDSLREFSSFQINQRPGIVLVSEIGDRAVFSGLIQAEPIRATIQAMLADVAAYRSFHAHFGDRPPKQV